MSILSRERNAESGVLGGCLIRGTAVLVLAAALSILAPACSKSPQAYLEAGKKHMEESRYNEAFIEFRNAVKKTRDSRKRRKSRGSMSFWEMSTRIRETPRKLNRCSANRHPWTSSSDISFYKRFQAGVQPLPLGHADAQVFFQPVMFVHGCSEQLVVAV